MCTLGSDERLCGSWAHQPQMTFAKKNELVQTLALDREHKALGVGVQVWIACRQADSINTAASKKCSYVGCEDRISAHDKLALPGKKALFAVEQIPHDLHHPSTSRLMHDAANLDPAARLVDDVENVVTDEASQREHLPSCPETRSR